MSLICIMLSSRRTGRKVKEGSALPVQHILPMLKRENSHRTSLTLVEVSIVAALFAVVGLTIVTTLSSGVKIWHVGEVIIFEIRESQAKRVFDKVSGFKLLNVNPE